MKLSLGVEHSRGIIVWDFDRVLFDTERQSDNNRRLLEEIGISEQVVVAVLARLKSKNKPFSIAGFIKELNRKRYVFSAQKIRKVFHSNLLVNQYYDPKVDRLLHRLRNKGFAQMVLSMGDAKFQRKKMFVGCGANFQKHFVCILVTSRPKFLIISSVRKKFPGKPIIFIDDTKENLDLVKKYIPGIITIYYSNLSGESLGSLERKILKYARSSWQEKS